MLYTPSKLLGQWITNLNEQGALRNWIKTKNENETKNLSLFFNECPDHCFSSGNGPDFQYIVSFSRSCMCNYFYLP